MAVGNCEREIKYACGYRTDTRKLNVGYGWVRNHPMGGFEIAVQQQIRQFRDRTPSICFPSSVFYIRRMTKLKVWCCHPVRHQGATKVGRAPSHPKGIYRVPSKLLNFIEKQHGVVIADPRKSVEESFFLCTCCYQLEMDQLRSDQTSVGDQQVSHDMHPDRRHLQRQASMNWRIKPHDCDDSPAQCTPEVKSSEPSSEDELHLTLDRRRARDICNDVLRILKIEIIDDM